MINSINLISLRNGEYIQFLTDVLNIVQTQNPATLSVKPQYDTLLATKASLENSFKTSQGSLVTEEITALDNRRDRAINGINSLVNGYTYSIDEAASAHAKTLLAHLGLFGANIARDNYQSETTTLRNIVNDWQTKPDLQAAVAGLGLAPWLQELEEANNAFGVAYAKRNQELATAPVDKLKTLRAEANEHYYKLRTRINSNLDINDGAEPWAGTVSLINQAIVGYNNLINRRGAAPLNQQPAQ